MLHDENSIDAKTNLLNNTISNAVALALYDKISCITKESASEYADQIVDASEMIIYHMALDQLGLEARSGD